MIADRIAYRLEDKDFEGVLVYDEKTTMRAYRMMDNFFSEIF